jgi:hypothetical protein
MRFEAARAPNVHIAETIAAMQRAIMANPLYNEKFGGSFVAAFGLANSAFNVLGAAQPSSEAREKEITRLATIEECARMADGWLAIHGGNEIKYTSAREYASDAVADVADAIRGLAHPSRNGEASRFPKTSSDVKPFTPCPGCDGHECDDGCRYPGAISSTTDKTP